MMKNDRSTRVEAPNSRPVSVQACSLLNSNDDMLSNPAGRSTSDGKCRTGRQKLDCRKSLIVAFQNVRTLRSQAKQAELSHLIKANGVEIIGLADHKIKHSDFINHKVVNGYLLITSSAWQNNQNVPNGGVGLMMNNKLKDCITNISAISLRILRVDFTGNLPTTLLVHYSSVEANSEADEHYSLLKNSIKECPNHNIVLVICDYNAHIGNEAAKYTYHQETNHNGALFINLSLENHLMIANTCFQKKSGKLWTYLSAMGGTKSQLDYILINKKWKNSIKNVKAYISL